MKTNFKRLFALVLTLCMLASLMVPVAFAEDVAVADPSAIVAETYPIRLKDMNHTDPLTATGLDKLMVYTNKDGETNYKAPSLSNLVTYYNNGTLNWKGIASSNEMIYRADHAYQLRFRGWGALQLRVSNPGLYSLKVTSDKNTYETWTNDSANWAGDVTAYVIPAAIVNDAIANAVIPEVAEGETAPSAEQVAISALMTDEYSVGTVSMAAGDPSVTFAKTRMDAGEHVVVLKASVTDFCVSEMALLETAEDAAKFEATQIANYGIRIVNPEIPAAESYASSPLASYFIDAVTDEATGTTTYSYKTASSGVGISKLPQSTTYELLGWKYLAGGCNYRPTTSWQYRLDAAKTATFQIKVPASGKFALTISTISGGSYSSDVYVVNVNDKGDAAYADLAIPENSIGSATATAGKPAIFESKYYEEGEYIVIISNTSGTNFSIESLGLIQYPVDVIPDAEITNTQKISTALYNIADPIFDQIVTEKTTFGDELIGADGVATTIRAYTDALYADGDLDWKLEAYAADFTDANFSLKTKDDAGLYVVTPDTKEMDKDWFALRLRVTTGGFYNLSMKLIAPTSEPSFYMFPADADTMSAEAVAEKMIPENGIYYQFKKSTNNQKISVGYLEGEYILIVNCPYNKLRTISLNDIVLESEKFTAEDVQTFNFRTTREDSTYHDIMSTMHKKVTEEVTEEVTNPETGETSTVTTTVTKFDPIETFSTVGITGSTSAYFPVEWDAEGNITALGNVYELIYKDSGAGYPDTLNWRPDAGYSAAEVPTAINKVLSYYNFGNVDYDKDLPESGLKMGLKNTNGYGSVMLRVEKAGTYKVMITGGQYGCTTSLTVIDAFETSYENPYGSSTVKSYVDGEKTPLLQKESITFKARTSAPAEVAEITVDAAGDYLFVFGSNAHVHLDEITLVPVIKEVAAGVGGATYATIEEAITAAGEGDTITLLDNVIEGGDVVVPAGATLDLNGLYVEFDSIDVAPGAQIIDSTDGQATLIGDVTFNENNAQLPLFDVNANGYHLYNTEVESCATTGYASSTKYWFKVKFSNADAFNMIGINSELRINAQLAGTYKENQGENAGLPYEGLATAGAEFTQKWVANKDGYIVVYVGGTGAFYSFKLTPAVSANGVVIGGDYMVKNT